MPPTAVQPSSDDPYESDEELSEEQLLAATLDIQRLAMRADNGRQKSRVFQASDMPGGGKPTPTKRNTTGLEDDPEVRKAAEDQRLEEARAKRAAEKVAKGVPTTAKRITRSQAAAAAAAAEEEEVHEWTAVQWLESLGLHRVIAKALDLPQQSKQFNHVRKLTRDNVHRLLSRGDLLADLGDALFVGVEKLQGSDGSTQDGAVRSDKFQTNAKFQMSYGSLSLFYGGLESLLGPPKMVNGSLFLSMAREHNGEADSQIEFKTPNGVTTTSVLEWEAVVEPDKTKIYPEREGRGVLESIGRTIVPLDGMMGRMETECNSKLRLAGHSELIKEELVGGRMYTGPCYNKYNSVLRAKSKNNDLADAAKRLCLGNDYVTTIHAINSCVLKLSKLTRAVKVWRGIKGATLPKSFWVANSLGVRGGIEYGFSSTSTDKDQALAYAGADSRQAGDASTIFEMQMGMVDRGADLSWLSQYPHEREVLLPPLTGLEALNHTVQGGILVINARLSLNMAAHTLEQVLSRRRKMLMDMCTGIELELRDALSFKLGNLAVTILQRALQFGPFSQSTEWFNDDDNFAQVMSSTLRLQTAILNNVNKFAAHMEKSEISLQGWKEAADSRMLLLAGWLMARTSVADVLVDLRGANVTDDEALILARLFEKAATLTSIDVRGNPQLGARGVAALTQVLKDEKPGFPRSVCGVSATNTRLEFPRQVQHKSDLMLIVAELDNHLFAESVSAGMGGKAGGATMQLNRRGGGGAAGETKGWQPLIWAARVDHREIAVQLLENGAKINEQEHAGSQSNKYSPLHVAALKGHAEMVELLLDWGADPSLKDVNGNSALQMAEKKGFAAISEMLDAAPAVAVRK